MSRGGVTDLTGVPQPVSDRQSAWDELHAALPPGWVVGRPSYHDERREWVLYAFDPSERPVVGIRQREWQAVAGKCFRGSDQLQTSGTLAKP